MKREQIQNKQMTKRRNDFREISLQLHKRSMSLNQTPKVEEPDRQLEDEGHLPYSEDVVKGGFMDGKVKLFRNAIEYFRLSRFEEARRIFQSMLDQILVKKKITDPDSVRRYAKDHNPGSLLALVANAYPLLCNTVLCQLKIPSSRPLTNINIALALLELEKSILDRPDHYSSH